jgi:hypothetical protein
MMIRRVVLRLLAFAPVVIANSAKCQAPPSQPDYVSVTLCEIAFHHEKVNPKYVSLDAEYVNATPHGLVLLDRRCPKRGLGIDFADTVFDANAEMMKKHFWEMDRATGTFRGILGSRPRSGLYLIVQSVLNLQPQFFFPDHDRPIQLPEPPLPKWPPTR